MDIVLGLAAMGCAFGGCMAFTQITKDTIECQLVEGVAWMLMASIFFNLI